MLASMSAPEAWSDLGVSELPTGTVTLLLADVEGSTRMWETQPEEMTAALARLNSAVADLVASHGGVRPVEQGEGDSFVVAFARASDAVACALELQRAPLGADQAAHRRAHRPDPAARRRQLRRPDDQQDGAPARSWARRPDPAVGRDGAVGRRLAAGGRLADRSRDAPLRDLPRPERVVQLCHPDIRNDFPPLRTPKGVETSNLPLQLTSFIGRGAQMDDVRRLLEDNRLVNLTGAGGAGKTRLAVEIAARFGADFRDGVHYVDLAPVTRAEVVPVAVARALGLPDQPGRSTVDSVVRSIGERRMLLVVDNCEHLLEPAASLSTELLGACAALRLLATSREPLGVPGEVTFLVPSLSIGDEAIDLFADRARRIRPDFAVTQDNSATVEEICRRLDGMPLAIELAAARVRALSLDDILGSLHDRFRLLTGGARTAVRRQQTLRASVDWSHALLTEPERVLFRRLAVFLGGFDLDAAQAVAGTSDVERYQVLDQLTLLVDKSLVVAENTSGRTRYKLLETVRQYALEKLGESGEADDVRSRHRDHFASMVAVLNSPAGSDYREHLQRAEDEIDNLRAAFGWSLERSDAEAALRLASSLFSLWQDGGRNGEGLAWLEAALGQAATTPPVDPAVEARALMDRVILVAWTLRAESLDESARALALAREVGDPTLVIRGLIARGVSTYYDEELAAPCFVEAAELAQGLDEPWIWSQIYVEQARCAVGAGDPGAVEDVAAKGLEVSTAIGNHGATRVFHWAQGWARAWQGSFHAALAKLDSAVEEAAAAHDTMLQLYSLLVQGFVRAHLGDSDGAHASADVALAAAADLMEFFEGLGHATVAVAYQAAGDEEAALQAYALARQRSGLNRMMAGLFSFSALTPLACGDSSTARKWADEVVEIAFGCYLSAALMTRAQVRLVQGEMDGAEQDAQAALSAATETGIGLRMSAALECLGKLAAIAESYREAARLFGAAEAIGRISGEVRLPSFAADYEAAVDDLRVAMGDSAFEATWAEGAALSTEEAIAYAQRGRGERKRPSSGWASLTPTELDVVRLLTEGMPNKDIATRLFISPRTVETHLTHVYAKLGLSSRVQLAQEAARHA